MEGPAALRAALSVYKRFPGNSPRRRAPLFRRISRYRVRRRSPFRITRAHSPDCFFDEKQRNNRPLPFPLDRPRPPFVRLFARLQVDQPTWLERCRIAFGNARALLFDRRKIDSSIESARRKEIATTKSQERARALSTRTSASLSTSTRTSQRRTDIKGGAYKSICRRQSDASDRVGPPIRRRCAHARSSRSSIRLKASARGSANAESGESLRVSWLVRTSCP